MIKALDQEIQSLVADIRDGKLITRNSTGLCLEIHSSKKSF